ncbi:MAG: 2-phospho-L-lactate guanylyltransferase [Anaerolineales bacterium]|jgi:2-phospho-L-lactate guanylyltransferase
MTLWAIVPVKPMRLGKSRLANVLSEQDRTYLNRQLLVHTIDTLKSVQDIEHVLVVSRDTAALSLAREHGARTVQEDGTPHLNVALTRATFVARAYNTHGVLVLPADLPLITAEDIHLLLAAAYDPPVVVVAPDRKREGTNALLISPPGLIEYEFGPHSFEHHCRLAAEAGARLEICNLPSLAFDVDWPEDLELLQEQIQTLNGTDQAI